MPQPYAESCAMTVQWGPTQVSLSVSLATLASTLIHERRRGMRLLGGRTAGLLGACLLVAVNIAGSAHAAARPVSLPVKGYNNVVTDPATGRVFISSAKDNSIAVADSTGMVLATIGDQDGATGMVVRDGVLYVALWKDQAISAIDTTTLAERTRYSTGAGTCPATLALVGANIWFGYGCNRTWGLGLGVLRLDTGTIALDQHGSVDFSSGYQPLLASNAGAQGPLIAIAQGVSPVPAHVFDVADGAARLRVSSRSGAAGDNVLQFSVTPNGAQVLVAAGFPYDVKAFSTASFAEVGRYSADNDRAAAVAVSPGGGHVAVGADGYLGKDVLVYGLGGATPVFAIDFGHPGGDRGSNYPADGGLAWSADGQKLYVVTTNRFGERPALRVLTPVAGGMR